MRITLYRASSLCYVLSAGDNLSGGAGSVVADSISV